MLASWSSLRESRASAVTGMALALVCVLPSLGIDWDTLLTFRRGTQEFGFAPKSRLDGSLTLTPQDLAVMLRDLRSFLRLAVLCCVARRNLHVAQGLENCWCERPLVKPFTHSLRHSPGGPSLLSILRGMVPLPSDSMISSAE